MPEPQTNQDVELGRAYKKYLTADQDDPVISGADDARLAALAREENPIFVEEWSKINAMTPAQKAIQQEHDLEASSRASHQGFRSTVANIPPRAPVGLQGWQESRFPLSGVASRAIASSEPVKRIAGAVHDVLEPLSEMTPYHGIPQMHRGAREIIHGPDRARGALESIRGFGKTAMPFVAASLPFALAKAPAATLLEVGGGLLAGEAAGQAAGALGARPVVQELAQEAGDLLAGGAVARRGLRPLLNTAFGPPVTSTLPTPSRFDPTPVQRPPRQAPEAAAVPAAKAAEAPKLPAAPPAPPAQPQPPDFGEGVLGPQRALPPEPGVPPLESAAVTSAPVRAEMRAPDLPEPTPAPGVQEALPPHSGLESLMRARADEAVEETPGLTRSAIDEAKQLIKGSRKGTSIYGSTVKEIASKVFLPVSTRIKKYGPKGEEIVRRIEEASATGASHGARLVKGLKQAGLEDISDRRLGMKDEGMNAEKFNLVDLIEGRSNRPVSERVADLHQAWTSISRQLAERAGTVGEGGGPIKVISNADGEKLFLPRENYFPHRIPSTAELTSNTRVLADIFENMVHIGAADNEGHARRIVKEWVDFSQNPTKNKPQHLIDYLMRTGQANNPDGAPSESVAMHLLQRLVTKPPKQRRFANLEFERTLNLPFYDPDPARVLPRATMEASARLEQIRLLGQNSEFIDDAFKSIRNDLANGVNEELAVADLVDLTSTMMSLNRYSDADARASAMTRAVMAFRLGLASIPNVTSGFLGTWLSTDLRTALKAQMAAVTKKGREFGRDSGATLDSIIQDAYLAGSASGGSSVQTAGKWADRFLRATGFHGTEALTRHTSANGGRIWAQKQFQRLVGKETVAEKVGAGLAKITPIVGKKRLGQTEDAARQLRIMGLDPDKLIKQGGPNEEDFFLAARKFSDMIQSSGAPGNRPRWADTPSGRVIWQFKNFSYNQTRLMNRRLIGELKAGRPGRAFKALLILAAAYPITGDGVRQIRNLVSGRDEDINEETLLQRWWEGLQWTAALGVATEAVQQAEWGNLEKFLIGPGPGEGIELATQTYRLGQRVMDPTEGLDDDLLPFVKYGWRKLPLIGQIEYLKPEALKKKKATLRGRGRPRRTRSR